MGDINGYIKGALIGGAIAGVAALLLAPKSGNLLMKDILDIYESAQKNGNDFIEAIKDKGSCLTSWSKTEECNHHYSLLAGGALGAVIGGLAALFLTPSSGKKLKEMLGEQYDDIHEKAKDFLCSIEKKGNDAIEEVNDWKDTFAELISKLGQNGKKKSNTHSNIDQIVNLAQIGIHLYQQLQNRR